MDARRPRAHPSAMTATTPEGTHALLAAALHAADLDAFVDVYEENATLIVPPDGTVANGRAEIRTALEPTFALRPRAEIEVVETLQSDGLALTHARWNIAGTAADGQAVNLRGDGTIVSRRQPDGSWRIVLDNPLSPRRTTARRLTRAPADDPGGGRLESGVNRVAPRGRRYGPARPLTAARIVRRCAPS